MLLISNEERITTSFEELNSIVFSGSFSTPPKINFLVINSLNDWGVENDPVILRTQIFLARPDSMHERSEPFTDGRAMTRIFQIVNDVDLLDTYSTDVNITHDLLRSVSSAWLQSSSVLNYVYFEL